MVTSSVLGWQTPLEILQRRMFCPGLKPETAVLNWLLLVKVAVPETTLQVPVPAKGLFAFRVVFEAQMVWSCPAEATVGAGLTVMLTSSDTLGHAPPLMVQRKVLMPVDKPDTVVEASVLLAKVPVPETTVQTPPAAAVAARLEKLVQMV